MNILIMSFPTVLVKEPEDTLGFNDKSFLCSLGSKFQLSRCCRQFPVDNEDSDGVGKVLCLRGGIR